MSFLDSVKKTFMGDSDDKADWLIWFREYVDSLKKQRTAQMKTTKARIERNRLDVKDERGTHDEGLLKISLSDSDKTKGTKDGMFRWLYPNQWKKLDNVPPEIKRKQFGAHRLDVGMTHFHDARSYFAAAEHQNPYFRVDLLGAAGANHHEKKRLIAAEKKVARRQRLKQKMADMIDGKNEALLAQMG